MKDYGLGMIDGLHALVSAERQLTDACFSEIGSAGKENNDYRKGKKVLVSGGMWDYGIIPTKNSFYSKDFKHVIAEDYETYTQLNMPDGYSSQPYFKAYDAKQNKFMMVFENGEMEALPVSAARIDPVFNRGISKPTLKENNLPAFVELQKIIGAKNKINSNYESVDDYYYMSNHHSKVIKSLEGYTNQFCQTLGQDRIIIVKSLTLTQIVKLY